MSAQRPPFASPSAPARERLGKYEILKHIATGGMADIHLARSLGIEGFEKLVVVKRILPQLARNREFVQMFLDEARIAATLHHSNIVQVYDIGSAEDSYFFAMEFLHGEDVRRIMKMTRARRQELPLEHALHIIQGACAGLHYAHEKTTLSGTPMGIVHRDVSPQNLFVTYDGGIKLVDFGIAKASGRLAEDTRFGTLKGKVRYMSPEQCRSQPIDRRSDIFSLGVVLWELTTGTRLYQGSGEFDVLKAIVEVDAPRPSSVKFGYPPELEEIVMRALRRNPEHRWQTAQQMQAALEEFARERKLAISPIALARFMKHLFGQKIEALEVAQREGGAALADHLRRTLDGPSDAAGAAEDSERALVTHTESSTFAPALDGWGASQTPGGSIFAGLTIEHLPPPRALARRVIVAVAAGLLVLAVGLFALLKGWQGPERESTAPPGAALPAPGQPQPSAVRPPRASHRTPPPAGVKTSPARPRPQAGRRKKALEMAPPPQSSVQPRKAAAPAPPPAPKVDLDAPLPPK